MNHITKVEDSCYKIVFSSYKHSNNDEPTFLPQSQTDTTYCPVLALKQYLSKRGSRRGPICMDVTRNPVNRHQFYHYLKQCNQLARLSHNNYTTHSLSIGRATQLAMDGVPETIIKQTGRWKSNAYQKYIRPTFITLPK